MNKIEKNKNWLIALSVGIIVLGVLMLGGGIVLTVFGGKGIASGANAGNIIELVFGILLIICSIPLSLFGIMFSWTGGYLKATHGSIAEDNLGKGTVNMNKCSNCGSPISGDETFCGNCGKSLVEEPVCPACGAKNMKGTKNCTSCGAELK